MSFTAEGYLNPLSQVGAYPDALCVLLSRRLTGRHPELGSLGKCVGSKHQLRHAHSRVSLVVSILIIPYEGLFLQVCTCRLVFPKLGSQMHLIQLFFGYW